MKRGEVFWFNW